MPLRYKLTSLVVCCLLTAPVVIAQTDPALAGRCQPAQAHAWLDIANVRASIFNGGGQFYGYLGTQPYYEVPKDSGLNSHFKDGLYIGGFVGDELRVAGSQYGPSEFWPGPLPSNGVPADCATYDRIYTIESSDLAADGTPTVDMLDWPVHLGAPYHELDGIPGYDPEGGDLPRIRGDQYLWWITNDAGNLHENTLSNPLGIEVHNEAWAFDVVGDIGNTTFFRHTIINKGDALIRDAFIGLYADVDLGAAFDDFPGSDSTLSLAYMYNADNDDDGSYGSAPPAFGFTLLEASHSAGGLPTNREADPSAFLTSIVSPNKGGGPFYEYPGTVERMYRFLQGLSPDKGLPMRASGEGWGWGGPVTNYIYNGDPATGVGWSALSSNGSLPTYPKDNRIMGSHGPFNLAPGDSASFTFAYVWGRGSSNLDSVTRLKTITAYLHQVKKALVGPNPPPTPPFIDGNPPEEPQFPFWVDEPYPNPAGNQSTLEMSLKWNASASITVTDVLGRVRLHETFQGTSGPTLKMLNTSSLSTGTYMIRVSQRGEHVDWPLIVL